MAQGGWQETMYYDTLHDRSGTVAGVDHPVPGVTVVVLRASRYKFNLDVHSRKGSGLYE